MTPTSIRTGGTGRHRILGISGSLRRDSFNRRLLRSAATALPPGVRLAELQGLRDIPPFDEDDESHPAAAVVGLREQIASASAVLIATPEYNGSLPGHLKNALDWASRPHATNVLRDKPVAVIGASPSRGGTAQANADTRRILARIGARVIDEHLLVPRAFEKLGPEDGLVERRLHRQLAAVVSSLLIAAERAAEHEARAA